VTGPYAASLANPAVSDTDRTRPDPAPPSRESFQVNIGNGLWRKATYQDVVKARMRNQAVRRIQEWGS
jgi:hypothetical protein